MALKKDCLKKLPGRLKATFFNTLHTLPITIACMTVATLTANALIHYLHSGDPAPCSVY